MTMLDIICTNVPFPLWLFLLTLFVMWRIGIDHGAAYERNKKNDC